MKIDCYLSKGCSSEDALRKNIHQALVQEAVDAEVSFYRISDSEAEQCGLKGSPSVLINGRDIQPVDVQGFS
jgi:hypothetical protein